MLDPKSKIKFQKALKLGRNRKYKEASVIFLDLIRENTDIPEAYLFLGRSYHGLNRMEDAVEALRHYIAIVPESAAGNFFLGRSLLTLGFSKNAIFYLKKAVNSNPSSMHANGFLGIAYLGSGRSDIAITYLSKAVESSTNNTGIYKIYLGTLFMRGVSNFNSGNTELASEMFSFLIENNFSNILPYIYMGMIERQNGNYKMALQYYEKALEFSPDDELLLFRRAVLLYKIGKKDTATEELKKLNIEPEIQENQYLAFQYFKRKNFNKAVYYGNIALHSDKNSINLHLLLGEANRELKKLDFSENHYRIAIKLDRTRLEGRYGLSLLLWMREKYELMMVELKKISISDPGNSTSSYYKALCMCKLDFNTNETIPAIQEEIRENDPDCYLFTALGEEYIKGGLEELAEKWFLKAIKINSNFKDAYSDLIDLYKSTGDIRKLLEAYRNYLIITEDFQKNKDYIHLLYKQKKYSKTILEINKILHLQPDNQGLLRILANSYRLTKKWDKSTMIYKQLLIKDPNNEIFLRALVYCLDHSGQTISAIKIIDSALSFINKPGIDLFLIKGVLCYKAKQYDEALKSFRKTLNDNSKDWRVYYNIAMIYKIKGIDDFADQFFARSEEYKNK